MSAIFLILVSCASSAESDKYVGYLDSVIAIMENPKIEAREKGTGIIDFAEKNKTDIARTLAILKGMSPKDTELVVDKVRTKLNEVVEEFQALLQASPKLAEDEKLLEALKALKVIPEE
jgi:hypothetical protein